MSAPRLAATPCCALPFAPTPPCAPASACSSRWRPTRCRALSGLSSTSEWIGGAALVIYGAALYMAAGLPDVRRVGVGVLAGNVAFAVLVTVVLVAGWLPLTELGVVATVAFTVVTLAFAYAQYLGVRRLA